MELEFDAMLPDDMAACYRTDPPRIVLNPSVWADLSLAERRALVIHEWGHHWAAAVYTSGCRPEDRHYLDARAQRVGLKRAVSDDTVAAALAAGLTHDWELAEAWLLPCDWVRERVALFLVEHPRWRPGGGDSEGRG